MLKSMTGYGRGQVQSGGLDVTVELRSVNHRFFEFTARVPRGYGYLEERLKKLIGRRVSRGKTEANVIIASTSDTPVELSLNYELARGYVTALRTLADPLRLRDDLTLSAVARLPDLFTVSRPDEDEDAVWEQVLPAAQEALDRFISMREREGERLRGDLLEKLNVIERHVAFVEERSPETVRQYRERLYQKLAELLESRTLDDARIVQEAGIYADRVAVDEETVRLRSHLCGLRAMLDAPEAVGRKLDFLLQECNREINTIGSKALDAGVARVVVEMKSEIEKIREQIQNIE